MLFYYLLIINTLKHGTKERKKSINETSNAKNIANFKSAYQIVAEMGDAYQPSNHHIQLSVIQKFSEKLEQAQSNFQEKTSNYKNNLAQKNTEMAEFKKLITKVSNSAKATNIPQENKNNISQLIKKLRGDSRPKPTTEAATKAKHSTSQQGIDNRLANFSQLISNLETQPHYKPAESELQTKNLRDLHARFLTLNEETNKADYALLTARKNLHEMLYSEETNLLSKVRDIKAYLKSLGTSAEEYYKRLVDLKFRTPTK